MEIDEVLKGQILQALKTCDDHIFQQLWADSNDHEQLPHRLRPVVTRRNDCRDQPSPDQEIMRLLINNNRRW